MSRADLSNGALKCGERQEVFDGPCIKFRRDTLFYDLQRYREHTNSAEPSPSLSGSESTVYSNLCATPVTKIPLNMTRLQLRPVTYRAFVT